LLSYWSKTDRLFLIKHRTMAELKTVSKMRITPRTIMPLLNFVRFAKRTLTTSALHASRVTTTIQYLEPLELYKKEKPYLINIPAEALPSGLATNESYIPYSGIVMEDMRGKENDFALDHNGFAVFRDHHQHNSAFKSSNVRERLGQNFLGSSLKYEEYDDYGVVKQKYRRDTERFLTHLLGAETTKTFTHEVRKRQQSFPKKPRGEDGSPQPIQGVHVGMSWSSSLSTIMTRSPADD
jgi:hypothetical protein